MKYGLDEKDIDALTSVFEQNEKISKILIYGSRVRGNHAKGSDIDLCILDDGFSMSDRIHLGVQVDNLLLPYMVDISIYRDIRNQDLIEHIDRVGEVFFCRV